MAYTNSKLVDLTMISPNSNNPRNHVIDTITIHHTACCVTAKRIGEIFAPVARQASCNYGVGSDGKVVMCVEEKNRSWCSSSPSNDHRAITIEVSNDEAGCKNGSWTVSELTMKKLIQLVADICKRNGIKKLIWANTATARINRVGGCNLTLHKDLAATGCPGPYLEKQIPQRIVPEVNKILAGGVVPSGSTIYRVQIGAFTNKANAEAQKAAAIKAGFTNAYIVESKKS